MGRRERKRKRMEEDNPNPHPPPALDEADLELSLSSPSYNRSGIPLPLPPPPPPPPPPPRTRRNPTQSLASKKPVRINPPYRWATDRRAVVHTVDHLVKAGITTITGEVECRRCNETYEIEMDLQSKFQEIASYVIANTSRMHDRAPKHWMNPKLLDCRFCRQEDCVKPTTPVRKRSINWLFLLLSNLIGTCNLSHLKYFCKHTSKHRTGAKDRLVYQAYIGLCNQLDPERHYVG